MTAGWDEQIGSQIPVIDVMLGRFMQRGAWGWIAPLEC